MFPPEDVSVSALRFVPDVPFLLALAALAFFYFIHCLHYFLLLQGQVRNCFWIVLLEPVMIDLFVISMLVHIQVVIQPIVQLLIGQTLWSICHVLFSTGPP